MISSVNSLAQQNIYFAAKNKHSKYIYCNEKFAELLGLDSPKSICGKNDGKFFQKKTADMCCIGDSYVLMGGILLNSPETMLFDKKEVPIIIAKNQIKTRHNKLGGIILSFVDTEHVAHESRGSGLKYNPIKKTYEFKIEQEYQYFTKREFDIFKNIILGLTAKQIALRLSLSFRTIEDYIEKIKIKLQCNYKHNIIEAALRYGITQQNIFNITNEKI